MAFENSEVPTLHPDVVAAAVTDRLSELTGKTVVATDTVEESEPLTMILVGGPVWEKATDPARDHLLTALDLVTDVSRVIIRATGSVAPPTSRARLQPWIAVLDEVEVDKFKPAGMLTLPEPDSHVDIVPNDHLAIHLVLELDGDFIARYQDLQLAARRAGTTTGDWQQAVLLSAAACEFLVKHVSWALEWEASVLSGESGYPLHKLFRDKPSQLISGVLSRRLGGSWDSSSCSRPVGSWRTHIARVRSDLLHRGTPVTENEAFLAIVAERQFSEHVLGRLADQATNWPRTSTVLALAGVETDRSRRRDLSDYLAWLVKHDTATETL